MTFAELSRKALGIDEHSGDGWFWELDARAKLIGIIALVVATAVLTRMDLLLVSLCTALTVAAFSMIAPIHLARMYLAAAPLILVASVSVFLFGGPYRGVEMLIRTSTCVLSLLILSAGTDGFALFSGLRRLRVPTVITTLLMLTQRYILVLSQELSRMTTARRARGFKGGRNLLDKYGYRVVAFTAGMVLVRSMKRADDIYEGLKCRGFSRDMSPWRSSRFAAAEAMFVILLLLASGSLLLIQTGVIV